MSKRNMEILQELMRVNNYNNNNLANDTGLSNSVIWTMNHTDKPMSSYTADTLNAFFKLTDPNYMFIADGKTTAQYKTKDIYLYAIGDDVEDSRGNVGVVIDILKPSKNYPNTRYQVQMYNATAKTCLTFEEKYLKKVESKKPIIEQVDDELTLESEATPVEQPKTIENREIKPIAISSTVDHMNKDDAKQMLMYIIDKIFASIQ